MAPNERAQKIHDELFSGHVSTLSATDPEFIADIRKLNVELDPLPGQAVQDLIARTLSVPPSVRERAKLAFGR